MLLRIPSVLSRDELSVVREVLTRAPFVDGKLSAGMAASRVKKNQEIDKQSTEIEALNNLVMGNLVRQPEYRAGAYPLRIAAPYYARYRPGMRYGDHTDDPIMGEGGAVYRCDVAVTIFLSAPDEYDGGELVVRTPFGESEVKLPAGDAVLYPASSLHRVNDVTRGERLVAVTWLQSAVRDPARRELLYELNQAREQLLRAAPNAAETAQVNRSYVNLVRMWSEV
jgi:PKHD-type hydroxylase